MAQTGQEYYGFLFEGDKKPTPVLDSLLRGIAIYIVCWVYSCFTRASDPRGGMLTSLQVEFVGNKEEKSLTPAKLASFYKAVGGNYDCAPPHLIYWQG